MLELELPFPPSVNAYYRSIPNRVAGGKVQGVKVILSEAGRKYKSTIAKIIAPMKLDTMTGRLALSIELQEPKPNRRRDIDNFNKGLWDALTESRVWNDDSQIDQVSIFRGEPGAGIVKITIQELS